MLTGSRARQCKRGVVDGSLIDHLVEGDDDGDPEDDVGFEVTGFDADYDWSGHWIRPSSGG